MKRRSFVEVIGELKSQIRDWWELRRFSKALLRMEDRDRLLVFRAARMLAQQRRGPGSRGN